MISRLPLLLLCTAVANAGEWQLYHARGADTEALAARVTPLLPEGVSLRLCELDREQLAPDRPQAYREAISAGVRVLPCLALCDEQGAYATLPLHTLCAERIRQAEKLASAPERAETAARRRLAAAIFITRLWADNMEQADIPCMEQAIHTLQEHLHAPSTSTQLRQLIALRALYPAFMRLYTAEYRAHGSHTPRSEKLLLQAISALEIARDADNTSTLGRLAFAERERLRAARLKSRQYE